jgi:hypothetical protein
MTDDAPEEWRSVLEPATWVTCRVTGPEVQSTDGQAWLQVEAAEVTSTNTSLAILAGWGGGGKYDHTEVIETAREVRIQVLIQHRVPTVRKPGVMYCRTTELRQGLIEVHLAAPMGERTLVGAERETPVGRLLSRGTWLGADHQPIDTVTVPASGI